MAEIITLAIDIALGALAYRLAHENRKRITGLETDVVLIKTTLRKAGLLDSDSN
jgi:hypothetical protein